MTDESWAGWYRDRQGSDAVILTTDGQQLHLRIRGVDFEGDSFDGLRPAAGTPDQGEMFALADGVLNDCVLEWDLPFPVVADGVPEQARLSCLLSLQPAGSVPLPGAAVRRSGLPVPPGRERLRLRARHHPAGSSARSPAPDVHRLCLLGLLPGARPRSLRRPRLLPGAKEAYRGADGEGDVLDLWDRRSGFVQETYSCPEFEPRPTAGAGTGHRGAFPLELA